MFVQTICVLWSQIFFLAFLLKIWPSGICSLLSVGTFFHLDVQGGGRGFFYQLKESLACWHSCCHGNGLCKQGSHFASAAWGLETNSTGLPRFACALCPHPQQTAGSRSCKHSAGASATSLLRHWEPAGLFSADSVLPPAPPLHSHPASHPGWMRVREEPEMPLDHVMKMKLFLAEMSEWKDFPSRWKIGVPFADSQYRCSLVKS